MGCKKVQGPLPGVGCRFGIVGNKTLVHERMAHAWIDFDVVIYLRLCQIRSQLLTWLGGIVLLWKGTSRKALGVVL